MNKGFTLIELLAVIVILAIIALIAVWHFLSVKNIVPSYMLPKPKDVIKALIDDLCIM